MPVLRATVAYLYAEDHLGTGIKKDDLRGFGVGPAGNVGVCDATSAAIVAPAERVSSSAAVPDVPTLGLARPALFLLEKRVEGQLLVVGFLLGSRRQVTSVTACVLYTRPHLRSRICS